MTPYPTEDVGHLIERAGSELFMFSSHYPHVEGGRHPLKRFEASLAARTEAEKQAFYADTSPNDGHLGPAFKVPRPHGELEGSMRLPSNATSSIQNPSSTRSNIARTIGLLAPDTVKIARRAIDATQRAKPSGSGSLLSVVAESTSPLGRR